MRLPLTSLFREVHKTHFHNPLADAVQAYSLGKAIDSASLKKSLDHIAQETKITPFLQKLFVVVFLVRERIYAHQDLLSQFLQKHIDKADLFGESSLLYLLIEFYLNPGSKEKTFHSLPLEISTTPKFYEETFFTSLLLIIGSLTQEREYFDLAEKHLQRVQLFLDHEKRPLLTLWCKEEDYQPFNFLVSYYILLQLLHKEEEKEQEEIYSLIQKEKPSDLLFFFLILEKIAQTLPPNSFSFCPTKEIALPDLLIKKTDRFTFLCSVTGINSSLGLFRGNQVECKAFGPQYYPLDDSRGFGIHRPPWLRKGALKTVMENGKLSVDGWFSMSQELGKNWSELSLYTGDNEVTMSFQFFGEKKSGMAFYMKADYCKFAEKTIHPQSLEHFQGEISKIFFGSQDEKISISFDRPRAIECISLAGQNFFWDSDYLLFFPNSSKEKISLTISY